MNKQIAFQSTETHYNGETGEITSSQTTRTVKIPREPPYVKMYLDDLCNLTNVPTSDVDVLRLVVMKIDYEGYAALSTRYRESICKKLNITRATLRNKLTSLSKAGLIKSVGGGEYKINPYYFGRGNWQDIYNERVEGEFTVTIKYKGNSRTIQTDVETYEIDVDAA